MEGLFFFCFFVFRMPLRRSANRSRFCASPEFNTDSDRDASPIPPPSPEYGWARGESPPCLRFYGPSRPPAAFFTNREQFNANCGQPLPAVGNAGDIDEDEDSDVCVDEVRLPLAPLPPSDDAFNYVVPAFFVGGDTKLLIKREENDGRPPPYSVVYEQLRERMREAFRDEELHPRAQWPKDIINGLVNQMREVQIESDYQYAHWRMEVMQPHYTVLETDSEDDLDSQPRFTVLETDSEDEDFDMN